MNEQRSMINEQLSIRTQHSTAPKPAAIQAGASAVTGSVEQRHGQVIALLQQDIPLGQIAAATGYSVFWVRVLAGRYAAADPRLGVDRRRQLRGRPGLLSTAQQHELARALQTPPAGGRWTGANVARWMAAKTGRHVHRQRGWEYLRRFERLEPGGESLILADEASSTLP